jgi:hypothetical protein
VRVDTPSTPRKLRLRKTKASERFGYSGHRNALDSRRVACSHLLYRAKQLFANVLASRLRRSFSVIFDICL